MTQEEKRIWETAYAAAFVAGAMAFPERAQVQTSPCGAMDNVGWRASVAESARGLADRTVRAFRETRWAGQIGKKR